MEHFVLLEWMSTFVESLVILSIISTTSGPRINGMNHYLHMTLCAFCLTLLTSFMNSLSIFSFFTPIVAMILIIPVLSKILSNGSLLIRSTACVVAYFVILTSGYILCAFFALIYGWSENTFSIITAPGMPRAMFLVFDKLINVTFYFLTRRFLPGISTLKRKFQVILLCACAIAYVSVQYLFNIFLHSDIATLQSTLLISWLYIFSFFIILIILFILAARSEQERQTHILLKSTNQLLTENYQKLYTYQQEHAKQIHDFNHHLKTLKGLASMKREHDIIDYIDSLLSVSYQEAMLCHSGSSIVDAIINYKAEGPDRKFCVNADKLSSRKEEQLRGFFGLDTGRLNSAYPPVFRGEKRYARAA